MSKEISKIMDSTWKFAYTREPKTQVSYNAQNTIGFDKLTWII